MPRGEKAQPADREQQRERDREHDDRDRRCSGLVAALSNPFAAVPSVHTCFSLIIGVSCFFLVRRKALRITWLFYPCLIVFSIVATANHFWLDAILGAVLAATALGVAWLIERRRPTLPPSARRRLRLEAGPEPAA